MRRTAARLWVWSAALLLTAPSSAFSDTNRYVNFLTGRDASGVDSTEWGRTAAKPWKSIAFANSHLPQPNGTNGNVILNIAGDDVGQIVYDAVPNPVNVSADLAAKSLTGKRYFIYGDRSDNTLTLIPAGTLTKSMVTLAYLTWCPEQQTGSAEVDDAAFQDTIRNCVIGFPNTSFSTAYGTFSFNADYSSVNNCTIRSSVIWLGESGSFLEGSGFQTNTCANLNNHVSSERGGGFIVGYGRADSCKVWFNTLTIDFLPQSGNGRGWSQWRTYNTSFRGNQVRIHGGQGSSYPAWTRRDSSDRNTYDADTVIVYGVAGLELWMSQVGSNPGTANITNASTFDSCYFSCTGRMVWGSNQSGTRETYSYTSLVSNTNMLLRGLSATDSCSMNHCTLVARNGLTGLIRHYGGGGAFGTPASANNTFSFMNNIVYNMGADSGAVGSSADSATVNAVKCGIFWGDSSNVAGKLASDYNLIAYYGYSGARYDLPVAYRNAFGTVRTSRVGSGSDWATWGTAVSSYAYDAHSVIEHPAFYDATLAIDRSTPLDLRIGATSGARGTGSGGSDIGAVGFAGAAAWQFMSDSLVQLSDTSPVADTVGFTVKSIGSINLTATYPSISVSAYSVTLDTSSVLLAPTRSRRYVLTVTKPSYSIPVGGYDIWLNFLSNDPGLPTRTVQLRVNHGLYPP